MKKLSFLFFVVFLTTLVTAKEYHVSVKGSDTNDGSASNPFKTISFAAQLAQPGDIITVHTGTYRERITPPRGGISDEKRIIYRAADGEKPEIKGSEVITGWKLFAKNVWKVTIPNTFFGKYNPYKDLLTGDWLSDWKSRRPHTGEVYLNGKSLFETNILEDVLNPRQISYSVDKEASSHTWYCESDETYTYIYANFREADPNREIVEINVRESCFYPSEPGRNFITVSGFHMSQAATQWAAPTAEQIGLIGTNWSKGWIIENNVISDSKCSGITLGKDRKSGHNVWTEDPCTDGAIHYNQVVDRALKEGWSKENIGSHIVRNNTIFNCEQTGICGSLGAAFSQIINNHIYNIWAKRLFAGAEMGGIKLHAAIDVLIKNNRIHNAGRGIWMDWMAQGTRISSNLLYDNTTDDLFMEVDHGPYLIDNNIFLSEISIRDWSEGGAFVHNLITGRISVLPQDRTTPYHLAHSTQVVALKNIACGDDRYYNNIFVAGYSEVNNDNNPETKRLDKYGLEAYNNKELQMQTEGNIYLKGAKHFSNETIYTEADVSDPKIKIVEEGANVYLNISFEKLPKPPATKVITTEILGKAQTPGLAFENPDGSPLKIDSDYSGNKRKGLIPSPGPFEKPGFGSLKIKVW